MLNGIKWEAKQTAGKIQGLLNSTPYNTTFGQTFSEPPKVALAFQQEMNDGDGSWALVHSASSTQLGLAVDEDEVKDAERSHPEETCGFIVFKSAGSYTQ
jgi:proteasome lid subunit RPN8/RPN11